MLNVTAMSSHQDGTRRFITIETETHIVRATQEMQPGKTLYTSIIYPKYSGWPLESKGKFASEHFARCLRILNGVIL